MSSNRLIVFFLLGAVVLTTSAALANELPKGGGKPYPGHERPHHLPHEEPPQHGHKLADVDDVKDSVHGPPKGKGEHPPFEHIGQKPPPKHKPPHEGHKLAEVANDEDDFRGPSKGKGEKAPPEHKGEKPPHGHGQLEEAEDTAGPKPPGKGGSTYKSCPGRGSAYCKCIPGSAHCMPPTGNN